MTPPRPIFPPLGPIPNRPPEPETLDMLSDWDTSPKRTKRSLPHMETITYTDEDFREQVIDYMDEWVGDYDVDASVATLVATLNEAMKDIDWSDRRMARATMNDRETAIWESGAWLVERKLS